MKQEMERGFKKPPVLVNCYNNGEKFYITVKI